VLDSYELDAAVLSAGVAVVAMHDYGTPIASASLVVSPAGVGERDGYLCGFRYVSLRPLFWGLPERVPREEVETVLVTAGGGRAAKGGAALATAARTALPDARVRLVVPSGTRGPDTVETLEAPASLLDALLECDLVVTAGGQTLLEALAAGAPCVAVSMVENQRRQTERLASEGAIVLAEPEGVGPAVAALAADAERRCDLARKGQELVDGFGALRIAFHVERLAAC
jgi:spore coat polysaccharide biosynthesis predicted glycosyltransferase SpsG